MEKFTDNILRPLNMVFAGLGLGLSAAIVATEAHVYQTYKAQSAANNPFWIPVWPEHFQTAGTKTAIGTASVILLLHLLYVAVYDWQVKSSHGIWESAPRAGMVLSGSTLVLAVISLIVTYQMNSRGPRTDTLETWTCRWSHPAVGNATAGNKMNDDFGTLCTETLFGLFGMIALMVMVAIFLISSYLQKTVDARVGEIVVIDDKAS